MKIEISKQHKATQNFFLNILAVGTNKVNIKDHEKINVRILILCLLAEKRQEGNGTTIYFHNVIEFLEKQLIMIY